MKKICILLTGILLTLESFSQVIVKQAGFESGTVLQGIFGQFQLCLSDNPGAGYISDSFAREGTKSLRLETKTTDSLCGLSYRAAVYVPFDASWYNSYQTRVAFSTYIPSWLPNDNSSYKNELWMQMQIKPKVSFGNPVLGLWLVNGVWRLRHSFDTLAFGTRTLPYKDYSIGAMNKGVWEDWVLLANFTINDPSGYIKLYKNGVLVIDIKGSNFNNEDGVIQEQPYFSLGPYKFGWPHPATAVTGVTKRVGFFDRILFGSPAATYSDFAPVVPPVIPPIPDTKIKVPYKIKTN